jgi:SAM-dependent methyltransferase
MNTLSPDHVRDEQRQEWGAAAPGWTQRREEVSGPSRPITDRLISLAGIRAGQRVLDLACGVGDPAFAVAELVGPDGYVLGLDVSEQMVAGARDHATARGTRNVEFRVVRTELGLEVPPGSFDVVTCRHGLMYMPDPVAAVTAWRDALKPGGRIAVSTWGPPDALPGFVLAMQIILRHVELPAPDPTAPGPFAIPTESAHETILAAAGLTEVSAVTFESGLWDSDTAADCWSLTEATAGPIVMLLASLPEEPRRAIRADAIETLEQRFGGGPVKLGGQAIASAGTRPS